VEAALQAPVTIEAASLPRSVPVAEESPRLPAVDPGPAPSAPKRRSGTTAVFPRVAAAQVVPVAVKAQSPLQASQDDDLGF
jgi:hypothetical protein